MAEEDRTQSQEGAGPAGTDHRAALRRGFANAAAVAAGVKADQRTEPTPCPAFDVGALVDHLVGAGWRVVALGRGEKPTGDEFPHVELADAAGQLETAAQQASAAWADDARLTATVEMPWGETYSGRVVVDMYLSELAAHAWDLAAATGQRGALDAELPSPALAGARAVIRPEYRDMMGTGEPFGAEGEPFGAEGEPFGAEGEPFGAEGEPFGAEGEPPAGAGDWDRFAAFMGRPPHWSPPAGPVA